MINDLVQTLIGVLPRFAEENGDFYRVRRDMLIIQLAEVQNVSEDVARNTIDFCEALLNSLAVLEPDALQHGEWCFVSFPAQLMALSVLTTLSDSDSCFFEPDFWNTRDVDFRKIERQREVLKAIENKRNDHHLLQKAQPIRYIHVAWSIIKHKGKILFFHREDKTRHDKNSGNYGLPGGRVNQTDLIHLQGNMQDKLRLLQSSDCASIKPALAETLKRELWEETELKYEQHYVFKPWRVLKSYRQVQGAKSNHALTEYFIQIDTVELTLEGFCYLQQTIAQNSTEWVWFSLDDMVQGKTSDGKTAFIEALYADFETKENMKAALNDLEDSFKTNYRNDQDPAKYRIVLPREANQPILVGAPGKETGIDLRLDEYILSLLLGLAACLRGFAFVEPNESYSIHPYGWLEVKNDCELQVELMKLAKVFKDSTDIVIENHKDRWFRLSATPDCVFFDDANFCCSVDKKELQSHKAKISVTAMRREFSTRLGTVREDSKKTTLSINVVKFLDNLNQAREDQNSTFDRSLQDRYRKSQLHEYLLHLGMRGLLRQTQASVQICCEVKF